jgi:hypothetical protein
MIKKSEIIKTLSYLPEKFSVDEFIDRLIFMQRVEDGIKDSVAGKSVSTAAAKKRLKKWLK